MGGQKNLTQRRQKKNAKEQRYRMRETARGSMPVACNFNSTTVSSSPASSRSHSATVFILHTWLSHQSFFFLRVLLFKKRNQERIVGAVMFDLTSTPSTATMASFSIGPRLIDPLLRAASRHRRADPSVVTAHSQAPSHHSPPRQVTHHGGPGQT